MKKHKQSHVRYTPKLSEISYCKFTLQPLMYEEEGSNVVGMVKKSQIEVKFHAFN